VELAQSLDLVLKNPETAWIGYMTIAAVVLSGGMFVVSGLLVKAINNFKQISASLKNQKKDYTKQIKNEANITPLLSDIRHNTYADRVCILQYHNGVHSIANNSLLKASMTHERLGLNTNSIINQVQNWPANYLGKINDEIFNHRYVAHPDIEALLACPDLRGLYEQIKGAGVKSVYCFPLHDAFGQVFGIGVIQYTQKAHELNSEWLKWTQARFSSIGTLLAGIEQGAY
jgi:hypothetical protein